MTARVWLKAILIVGLIVGCGLVAGCSTRERADSEAGAVAAGIERGTEIRLPDGLVCRWRPGTSPDGPYECGSGEGGDIRLAAPPLVTGRTMRATLNVRSPGGTLSRRALVSGIEAVVLSGGSVCRDAGNGSTLTFEGSRLNFTCAGAAFDGLVGSLRAEGATLVGMAVRVVRGPGGARLEGIGRVPLRAVHLEPEQTVSDTLSIPAGHGLISRRS